MNAQTESYTRLHGRWLFSARLAWVAIAILATLVYAAAAPVAFNQLQSGCGLKPCDAPSQIITESASLPQDQIKRSLEFGAWFHTMIEAALRLLTLGVALLIFWRRSDDWMAHVASIMLVTVFAVFSPSPMMLANVQPLWRWPITLLRVIALASTVGLFYLFPEGRFVPRWTRGVAIGLLVLIGALAAVGAPFQTGLPVFLIALATGAGFQVYRYRRVSNPLQRQQTKWVVLGITGMVLPMLVFFIFGYLNPSLNPLQSNQPIFSQDTAVFSMMVIFCVIIPLCFLPVTLAFSLLRYRLWDVDIVINRTLVYGALTGIVVSAFVIIVGFLSALFQSSGNSIIAIIATGLVALFFNPLRQRLQRGINHLMYGERDDPYAALSRLGRQMESTLAPDAVLPTVVTTVGDVLKLPYVAIYLKQEPDGYKIIAEAASPFLRSENGRIFVPGMNTLGLCVPLIHQGETLGYIVLGPRAPNEAFSSTDLRLLDDLASQVGVAVHAVRLTADLQRSREQLVLAREEERRRLRRDLHDDLAPTLASLGLTASTAADLIRTNPTTATALVKELQTEIRATVGNIRRLVYDLRPPTLDELGLLAAVRERAAQYTNAPDGVHITVDAPAELPALPAAVEVAAYRIVQEALENVSKHSQSHQCTIRFANHNGLEIEIMDDGIGLPPNITPGVGLRSMRERAEELGGSCVIDRCVSSGTRVLAHLPIGEFDGTFTRPDRG
jgi:signal transduction histidine kinase